MDHARKRSGKIKYRPALLLAFISLPTEHSFGFLGHQTAFLRTSSMPTFSAVDGDLGDVPRNGVKMMKLVAENLETRTYVFEARLKSPLGIKLAEQPLNRPRSPDDDGRQSQRTCVVVCDVVPGTSADEVGVRRGDRIVATGAPWGGAMWDSSTVEGVTSSVGSKLRLFGEVKLRIERPFDGCEEVSWRSVVSETFTVDLRKPLGLKLEDRVSSGTGAGVGQDQEAKKAVFVQSLDPSGTAAASGKISVGDRVLSVSASLGSNMWEAHTVEGVISATAARLAMNQPVRLKFERQVEVGAWQVDDAPSRREDEDEDEEGAARAPGGGAAAAASRRRARGGGEGDEEEEEEGNENEAAFNSDAILTGSRKQGEILTDSTRDATETKASSSAATHGEGESLEPKKKEKDEEKGGAEEGTSRSLDVGGIGSTVLALEELKRMDVSSTSTQAVLLERCCYLIYKCSRSRAASSSEGASKVMQVADTVFGVAELTPSSKFVNMAMSALLKFRRPRKAVALYDTALSKGLVPTLEVVTTLARALTPTPAEARRRAKLPPWDPAAAQPTMPSSSSSSSSKKALVGVVGPAGGTAPPRGGGAFQPPWKTSSTTRPTDSFAPKGKAGGGGSSSSPTRRLVVATALLEKRGVVPDTFFLNTIMRCYMLNGQVKEAEDIFYRVMKAGGTSASEEKARPAPPDRFSWNIMIDGYARRGRPDLATQCFQDMSTAAAAASAANTRGDSNKRRTKVNGGDEDEDQEEEVEGLLADLPAPPLRPDLFTCTALLKAFVTVDDFSRAEDLVATMETALLLPSASSSSSASRGTGGGGDGSGQDGAESRTKTRRSSPLSEAGDGDDEHGFFGSIATVSPDIGVYNTLLAGYCRTLRWREALDMVARMEQVAGLAPNYDSFAHLVPCLCRAGHPGVGLSKLEEVKRLGVPLDTKLYTMFVVCHARLGDPVGALELLRDMKTVGVRPSLKTFTAVMDACLRAGNADLCLAISAELKQAGAEPDEVVYTMIVRAYGLRNEVRKAALLVTALQREAQQAQEKDEEKTQAAAGAAAPDESLPPSSSQPTSPTTQRPRRRRPTPFRPGVPLYNTLLKEAAQRESWAIALGALEEVLLVGRPNDATYDALSADPLPPLEGNGSDGAAAAAAASTMGRAKFLFDAVERITKSEKDRIRIAGSLYVACLAEALKARVLPASASSDGATPLSMDDAAEALIAARRRGEVRLRVRDEAACIEAERAWEAALGRVIEGSEWMAIKLFEEEEDQ